MLSCWCVALEILICLNTIKGGMQHLLLLEFAQECTHEDDPTQMFMFMRFIPRKDKLIHQ